MRRLATVGVAALVVSSAAAAGATTQPSPIAPAAFASSSVGVVSLFAGAPTGIDRFGELLVDRGHGWVLDTPPGVATNGGIAISISASTVTAAVAPSQLLAMTALATSNATSVWAPDLLPHPIAPHAGALSVRAGIVTVLERNGSFATRKGAGWSTSTLRAAAAAKACGGVLTDVVQTATGIVAGRTCRNEHGSPLLAPHGTVLLARQCPATADAVLLRLVASGTGGARALLDCNGELIAAQSSTGALWSTKHFAPLLSGASVLATAISPSGQVAALISSAHGQVVATSSAVVSLTGHWNALAYTPAGQLELIALANHPAHQLPTLVTIAALRGSTPVVIQQLGIDVPYGSSA